MGDAGNDTIRGDAGKDLVHGGDGDDGVGGGTHVREGTDPGDSVFGDGGDDVFMTQGDDPSEHKDRASGEETAEVVWPPVEPWRCRAIVA